MTDERTLGHPLRHRPHGPVRDRGPRGGYRAGRRRVARVLTDVLESRDLVVPVGNGHVRIEGWTLLGSMVGVAPEVEWSRPIPMGWEARATARTADGRLVGNGEAQCTREEKHWRDRDDYALRSMAQTRAVSKALRMGLGFIVQLAGYDATPAEELPADDYAGVGREAPPRRRTRTRKAAPEPAPAQEPAGPEAVARMRISEAARVRGLDADALLGIAAEAGVDPEVGPPTQAQLDTILAAVEALPIPADTPLAEVPDHEFPY